jgi:GMP synthase-like glutamine amidotransferase
MRTIVDKAVLVSHEGPDDFELVRAALPGVRFEFIDRDIPEQTNLPFDRTLHAALVVMGDTKRDASDPSEQRRVRAARAAKAPVAGFCFGGQAIAFDQNREVDPKRGGVFCLRKWHWGVEEIDLTDEGEEDPVTRHLLQLKQATMAHKWGFETPHGATALAWSGSGIKRHCEAFRVGEPTDAVYGFQFHPEQSATTLKSSPQWFCEGSGRSYELKYLKQVEVEMAALLRVWGEFVRAQLIN